MEIYIYLTLLFNKPACDYPHSHHFPKMGVYCLFATLTENRDQDCKFRSREMGISITNANTSAV